MPQLDVETRYRFRIAAVMFSMILLAQPYAMLWQLADGNGKVRSLTNIVGLRNVFDVASCGLLRAIAGLMVGLWRFKVSLRDVTLDKGS